MTKFILIRHALTDAVGKRLSGRTPGIHLNPEGFEQAHNLAQRLTALPVAAIYSSPLERAVETAIPIAESLHLQNVPCNDFNEIDFGEWTNRIVEDIKDQPLFQQFNSFRSCTRIPGGELMSEAQCRIISGIENLRLQHQQQTVAIVSHADLIKAAIAWYAGIHLDMFHRIEISPASISVIELYDETARILVVNNTGDIAI
ncbi:MAG: hypothetical protein JWP81_2656 [Ferruginibacter sp.]|nr:hypothetical protein [Ferruginibacter sp.]